MSTYKAGDTVKVLPPFDAALPDVYTVEGVDDTGSALINGGSSFADEYLQLVAAGSGLVTATAVPALITKLAFRQRFTETERIAIEIASLDDPSAAMPVRQQSAAIRVYMADLVVANSINLTDPVTMTGVQMLEAGGLIGAGRSSIILGAPIQPSEAA